MSFDMRSALPNDAGALVGVLALLAVSLAAGAAGFGAEPRLKLKVDRHKLSNGLTVLTAEDPAASTVSFMTFVAAGSRDEVKPGTTGLAHVFEHLMFRGTPSYPDYNNAIARFGPETNATTSQDFTRYFVNVRAEHLEEVIKVEADRFRNLSFTFETFRTEMGPVREERRKGYVDAPDGFLFSRLYELAFGVHTYHHPVIGYEADLEKNITYEDTQDFRRAHYQPGSMTIVVAGGFDTTRVMGWIEKYYGDLRAEAAESLPVPLEPEQAAERREAVRWKDGTISPRLAIAFHAPAVSASGDYPALEILGKLLNLDSRPLKRRLYAEMQLVESLEGGVIDHKDPSLFYLYAVLKKGKRPDEVESVAREEMARLASDLVPEADLARAKNALAAETLYRLDRPYAVASALGAYEVLGGDYRLLFTLDQARQAVTRETVREAARRTFTDANRTVVSMIPAPEPVP